MTLSGTLALVVDSNFAPVVGNSLTIINTTGGVSGKFSDVNNVVLPGGLSLEVLYGTHDVKLAVVPEPSSYALIAFGLLVARVRARACLRRSLCRRGAHHNRITMEK